MDSSQSSQHFSEWEKDCAIEIILQYLDIVENKKTDGITNKQKTVAWENISKDYNASNINVPRTTKQLKNLYENLKRKTKRKIAERTERHKSINHSVSITKEDLNLSPVEEKIFEVLIVDASLLNNGYYSSNHSVDNLTEGLYKEDPLLLNETETSESSPFQDISEIGSFQDNTLTSSSPQFISKKKRKVSDVIDKYDCKQSDKRVEKSVNRGQFVHNQIMYKLLQDEQRQKNRLLEYEIKLKQIQLKSKEIEFKQKFGHDFVYKNIDEGNKIV